LWDYLLAYINDNRKQIDGIVIAGDYLDMASIGSYNKGHRIKLTLADEYGIGYREILKLNDCLKDDAEKFYLYGNHEFRYIKEMKKVEVARFGSALTSPEEAMKLDKLGYNVLTNYVDDFVLLGDLEVFHGSYVGTNAMKKHLNGSIKRGHHCLFFHTHITGMYTEGRFTAYNYGGLLDRWNDGFSYANRDARQNWTNGFAEVIVDDQERAHVSGASCTDSGFFLNGKWYGK
jgi:hypothetical protein